MNSSTPSLRQRLYATCGEPGFVQCNVASWIWKIVPFSLFAFGTVGNILSLIVLMRRTLRKHSTTVFFICLAISDLTMLWTGPFRNVLLIVKQFDLATLSPFHCKVQEAIAHIAAGTSFWTLVMLTIERDISVMFPIFARANIKRRHTAVAVVSEVAIIAVLNCHYLVGKELQLKSDERKLNNTGNETAFPDIASQTKVCVPSNDVYTYFLSKWWNGIVLTAYSIVPFVLILSGNTTIALTLFRRGRNTQLSSNQRSEQIQSVTKLLFGLSGFFFSCATPYCVFQVVFQFQDESLGGDEVAWLQLYFAVVMMLLCSNFTFNFCFYFLTGSAFRLELYALIAEIRVCFRLNPTQVTNSGQTNLH